MNYIVMDLEWNQSPDGKANSIPSVPFEILQIGAVKLDENLNEIDQYSAFVKPVLYERLHWAVASILNIGIDELRRVGRDFATVAGEFLDWCGEDFIFCTWGGTDLIELQRNLKYYKVNYTFPMPFLFYDLQKLYSRQNADGKTMVTLQNAIIEQQLPSEESYHMADSDARYAAKILETLDMERLKIFYSVDTFVVPSQKKKEIFLKFDDYCKYISRGFSSRENAAWDREVRSCKCFYCNRPMRKITKWFSTNAKIYHGAFECEEHGLIRGKFKVHTTDEGVFYIIKIFKKTDEEGIQKIKDKQIKEREHRRIKRKNNALNRQKNKIKN